MGKSTIKKYQELVATIEQAKIYDGRGEYNLYKCDQCGAYVVTLYKDKGVTPFIMMCKKCNGAMHHTQSSRQAPPPFVEVHNWVRPTLEQTLRLSEGLREHVLNGGLVLEEEIK